MLSRMHAPHVLPPGFVQGVHQRAGVDPVLAWLRQRIADRVPRAGQHSRREHVLTRLDEQLQIFLVGRPTALDHDRLCLSHRWRRAWQKRRHVTRRQIPGHDCVAAALIPLPHRRALGVRHARRVRPYAKPAAVVAGDRDSSALVAETQDPDTIQGVIGVQAFTVDGQVFRRRCNDGLEDVFHRSPIPCFRLAQLVDHHHFRLQRIAPRRR